MLITSKHMVTGDGKTKINSGALLLRGDRIEDVGTLAELRSKYPDEAVDDYGDATILPGLTDMHVHLGYWYNRSDKDIYDDYLVCLMAQDYATRALKTGITTVRDVASPGGLCQSLIVAAQKGYVKVPRIIHCNMALNATGGHAWKDSQSVVQVDGVEEVRKAVRTQVRSGATWIKMMSSHRTSGISEYTQEEISAAADEARRHQVKIAIHAGLQPSIEYAVNAGYDTIEHGTEITEEQAKRMVDKGMAWTPTIQIHDLAFKRLQSIKESGRNINDLPPGAVGFLRSYGIQNAQVRKNLRLFTDMGLLIVSGTDMIAEGATVTPVARELAVFVEYGLEPLEAIAIGTSNCAKVLGMEGEIGILTTGAKADILVSEGDASEDISSLEKVVAVYFAGEKIQ